MENRIKNEIKNLKKYKPKTKSITKKYSEELVNHIQYLADIYSRPRHKFLVDCISGAVIRADDDTAEDMAKFQSIQSTLSSNMSQAKILIEYIKDFPQFGTQPIKHESRLLKPLGSLEDALKKMNDIIQPILDKTSGKGVEHDEKIISAKNAIISIPRLSGINTRQTRGAFAGNRIKLELNEADLKKLKAKANFYFEYRCYVNDEDNACDKPNETAALIQMIYDAEPLTNGYAISISNIKSLDQAGTKFNNLMIGFNTMKKQKLYIEPQKLFDAMRELYVAIKKLNIE